MAGEMMRLKIGLLAVGLLLCLVDGAFAAQPIVRDLPPGLQIPAAARTGPSFDVDQATQAFLNCSRRSSASYRTGTSKAAIGCNCGNYCGAWVPACCCSSPVFPAG